MTGDHRTQAGSRSHLPTRVLALWRLQAGLVIAAAIVVIAVVFVAIDGIPIAIPVLLTLLVVVLGATELVVIPIRYRTWWFAIGEEQIDLERGVFFRTHTVIPMTRVQHVELERGPLASRFHLAELKIHTAAGSVTIPALDQADGERIRQRIAELARIADDL